MKFLKHAALKKGILNLCQDAGVVMCLLIKHGDLCLNSSELKKPDMSVRASDLCLLRVEMEESRNVAGQPAQPDWRASILVRDLISKTNREGSGRKAWPQDQVYPHRVHTVTIQKKKIQARDLILSFLLLYYLGKELKRWIWELICWVMCVVLMLVFLVFYISFTLLLQLYCDWSNSHYQVVTNFSLRERRVKKCVLWVMKKTLI